MMHHSFEHMTSPRTELLKAAGLLSSGGRLLLRVPLAGKWAWDTYGINWIQLDPPRHLTLHTEESVARLAAATGFEVQAVVYDSTAFQIWGSERSEERRVGTECVSTSRSRWSR